MAINPNIALQVQTPQVDVASSIGNALALKGRMLQMERAEQDQMIRGRDLADQTRIREILGAHGGDVSKALPEIRAVNPAQAMELQQGLDAQGKAAADRQIAEMNQALKKLEVAGRIAGTMSADNFDVSKQAIAAIVGDELAGFFGDTYDPAKQQQALKWALTAEQQITLELTKARDAATQADREADNARLTAKDERDAKDKADDNARQDARDRELARHNREMEKIGAQNADRYSQTGKPGGDVYWDRDRKEYEDYVRQHEKGQEGVAVSGGTYQPAEPFEDWRMRVKGRGGKAMTPGRPQVNPDYGKKPAPAAAPAAPAPKPAAQPARDPKALVGKTVRLKDGRVVKVKAVNPDGSLVTE